MSTWPPAQGYRWPIGWPDDDRRLLDALARWCDPRAHQVLAAIGVRPGWRCLSAGAATVAIASWLADRVGPAGHVIAAGPDPRMSDEAGPPHPEIGPLDGRAGPLPVAYFDLVHARCTLQQSPDPDSILRQLLDAVRPGGWLVIEELDACPPGTGDSPGDGDTSLPAIAARVWRDAAWFAADQGTELTARSKLMDLAPRLPLRRVHSTAWAPLRDPAWAEWAYRTLKQFQLPLLAEAACDPADLDTVLETLATPGRCPLQPPLLVSTWGQRPDPGVTQPAAGHRGRARVSGRGA